MTPNAMQAWSVLTSNMSQQDQQQLQDVLTYMHERASDPSGYVGEGSIPALINRQLPAVRNALAHISEAMETPRPRPFMEKFSEAQNADALGLDPQSSVTIKQALDTSDVLAGVIDRMGGSDADNADRLDSPELSRQEQIAAAFDLHSQE
jgi:hypothetical protein